MRDTLPTAMARGVGILSLFLPATVLAAAGALPVKTVTVKGHRKHCSYQIDYPRTGQARIDADLGAWVEDQKHACDSDQTAPAGNQKISTTWSPTVMRNDDQLFAVSFEEEVDSEMIHDTHERETFNFLRPDGWQVDLAEIFEPAALSKISRLAIAALEKEMPDEDAVEAITAGAGPDWGNFSEFVLQPKTLDIYFASERVGTYADGPQEIQLPLSELAPFFRKDWRAPAPSFDCTKAGTPVEHAICGDVPLARRDRQLQAIYAALLRHTAAKKKEALRQAQHAWLQQRNATCGVAPPAGIVGCLDGLYQKRLTALESP
jgi:uncharacterized protein YecT (DUF1311 family)